LYWLLDRHPAVYMAKPVKPEPKFFLVDDLYRKGIEFYARTWFGDAGDAEIAGEKSTDYLENATAAERIGRDLPNVKLVFILREPVERAYSNYLWTRMNGLETEDFETALWLEDRRERELPERLRFARPYAYFSRGLYADLLRPYMNRFPRKQLQVFRFEDIIARPREIALTLHEFLGVETRPDDADAIGVINPADRPDRGMGDHVRRELSARYAEPNRQLQELLGPTFEPWR
jgi:Sulfotransferase domain